MRSVFPPERCAIAVLPLTNWGGLEITDLNEACVEIAINNGGSVSRQVGISCMNPQRASLILSCTVIVIIWTNSREYNGGALTTTSKHSSERSYMKCTSILNSKWR